MQRYNPGITPLRKGRKTSKEQTTGQRLLYAGNTVIRMAGSLIFIFLSWYCLRFTQYMPPGAPEIPLDMEDSLFRNLSALICFIFSMAFLVTSEKKLSAQIRKWILRCLAAFMAGLLAFACFQWICSADREPGADPFYICHTASSFLQGIYVAFQKGAYCEIYPQQLGMIALLEALFFVVGANQYFAFEVLSALLVPAIAFLGYRILRELTDDFSVCVCYCVAMTCCLPLVFYTSYVYGEIPGIFFSFLAVFFALRYGKRHRLPDLLGIALSFSMAYLVRKNSLILMIAFFLTALLWSLAHRDKKMLVAALLAIVTPYLAFAGIQQMYEWRSGIEKSSGIPASAWVALGLEEHAGRFGWYYDSGNTDIYQASGCNRAVTDAICRQKINERLAVFWTQPSYAIYFFKYKQLSQWNAPLYQSYFLNQSNSGEENAPADNSLPILAKEHFTQILDFCNTLQLILYLGMLFYFLFAVRKDTDMLQNILPVMIVGGFLFSMIWEAKARYILPYYIAMFPMAFVGHRQFLAALTRRFPCTWTARGFRSLRPPQC